MPGEAFFSLNPYHVVLTILGVIMIVAVWLPRLVSRREPASAPLLLLLGAMTALLLPDIPVAPDPRQTPLPWEAASEERTLVAGGAGYPAIHDSAWIHGRMGFGPGA